MSKTTLVEYLVKNGKDDSWENLAKKFELGSGEIARHAWKNYRRSIGSTVVGILEEVVDAVEELEYKVLKIEDNCTTGEREMTISVPNQDIKTLDELIEKCSIDTTKYKITKWIQNVWNNRYQVKAWLSPILPDSQEGFSTSFKEFLETYKSSYTSIMKLDVQHSKPNAAVIINKQDSHLNKFDISGDNSISNRFIAIESAIDSVVKKATISYDIDNVVYVLGSDQFNSEWTNMTTKGTPQQNLPISFQDTFKMICDHEVSVISNLLEQSKTVTLVFLSGNHDEFVGWHMVNWLAAYFNKEERLFIDDSTNYRKYVRYGNTGIMLNHGDSVKPEKLAGIFPVEFKDHWSSCEHYVIFTGDKHHLLAKEINGITFYQIPALSSARSLWDDKNGHVCSKAEMTTFVISDTDGITDIYKNLL